MKSVAEIIRDVSELPEQAQNQVSAHLLRLRRQRDDEWRRRMAEKIDDQDPANWVSLEAVQAMLLRDEPRQ